MGLTTCLMLGALTLGGSPVAGAGPAARVAHQLLQLDAAAVVSEGRIGLEFGFPLRSASPEAPLAVVVTGLAAGVGPFELDRQLFAQPGAARALVRHSDLAVWDQVVVSWAQPDPRGAPQAGFLARIAGAPAATGAPGPAGAAVNAMGPLASLGEQGLAGAVWGAASEPKTYGGFLIYECPKTAKEGCTVHLWSVNLQTGSIEETQIPMPPNSTFTINASLPAGHSCTGCE